MILERKHKKEFIPALGYNWLTNFYDLTIKLTMPERKFRNKIIQFLNPKDDEEILEFGFGTAQNLILAYQNNKKANYVGLDIDPKVKKIAKHKLESENIEIPLVLYDGEAFPFKSNTFNKIFSSLVFHQLDTETKKHCLKEIFRVLKPKGELIIGDWGKPKSKFQRLLFYVVQLLDGFKTTQENVEGKLPIFMSECGFKNVNEIDFIKTKIGTYCYYKGFKIKMNN